jgi:hypothetical protein
MARGRKCRSSQADLDAAVEAVVTGASYKAAEEMTGVPRSTVRDYVVRRGLVRGSVPRPGRKKGPSVRLIRALEVRIPIDSGHPFRSIPDTHSGVFGHPQEVA